MKSNGKLIAKNTGFLYIRMILIMAVNLYMSRVLLDKLGVVDYGLYNTVGGVVAMLAFLNSTLSNGTSRFLTFELGKGNFTKLKNTFSTTFYSHLVLSAVIVLFMETVGLWFMYNKLVIPENRLNACFWVFQISIVTTVVSMIQVPYTASVISHERMGVYAYVSIYEAFAKLGLCYLLTIGNYDKLILYAILIAVIHISVSLYYTYYCLNQFKECRLAKIFDKRIFVDVLSFSGWNLMAHLTETLKLQGVVIIINMFLSPAIVAAQSLANQVSSAMMQFVNNFRQAINPQIIKLYAAGEIGLSKKLTLETTVYCFDLMLLIGLPAIYCMKVIMGIWLVEVPDYAVAFTQWVIAMNIIRTFSTAFYIPMMATNKIKTNSVTSLVLGIVLYGLMYFVLQIGWDAMWVQYIMMINCAMFSTIITPWILYKEIGYSMKELIMCFIDCFKVLFLSLCLSLPVSFLLKDDSLVFLFVVIPETIVSVLISSIVFMRKDTRIKLLIFIRNKFHS